MYCFVAGDFSLDIKDVTLEDDGVYQCQVSSALKNGKYTHWLLIFALKLTLSDNCHLYLYMLQIGL